MVFEGFGAIKHKKRPTAIVNSCRGWSLLSRIRCRRCKLLLMKCFFWSLTAEKVASAKSARQNRTTGPVLLLRDCVEERLNREAGWHQSLLLASMRAYHFSVLQLQLRQNSNVCRRSPQTIRADVKTVIVFFESDLSVRKWLSLLDFVSGQLSSLHSQV